jgi:hypothetical protein
MIRSLLGRKKNAPSSTAGTMPPDTAEPEEQKGSEEDQQAAGSAPPVKKGQNEATTAEVDAKEGGGKSPTRRGKGEFKVNISRTGKNLQQKGLNTKNKVAKDVPLDVLGCVLFLQGKLKEMTDIILGPEQLRLLSRGQPDALLEKLQLLLHGQDETSAKIRRGLALSDASRHRPDIDHPQPMEALKIFEAPRFEVLRRFSKAATREILHGWQQASQEFVLASTLLEFLKFIEMDSKQARETVSARALVDCMILTCGSVLNNRHEIMSKEPEMTRANMLSIATQFWSRAVEGSEQKYRQLVVKEWTEERADDIICIMEDNVEQLSPGGDSLWGTLDYKYERLKVNTAFFNFLDFIVNFLNFAYEKGYVFKPSSNPPSTWTSEEVVEWFANLRLHDYVDKVRASGITGNALLECNLVDLECALEITDPKDREKVWRGLETLRLSAHYEFVPRLERETRALVTLKVPDGEKGGGKMLVQDPAGKSVTIDIPKRTVDGTRAMKPGMEFRIRETHKKTVLNKWQKIKNVAVADIGGYSGCVRPGEYMS